MSDEFIGQKFGSLTVVGIAGRNKQGAKEYSCFCSECAKDPELHGDAIFHSTKSNIVNRGLLPCGCSANPKWSADQYKMRIERKAAGKYSVIVPTDANSTTKALCTCCVAGCGHTWDAKINSLLRGTGCKQCSDKVRVEKMKVRGESTATPESVAIDNILRIANEKNWIFLGFKSGWKNVRSRLLLECHCGRSWSPTYTDVVHTGIGCASCSKYGYDSSKRGWFYTYLWIHPETNHQFLKYGITNHPTKRLQQQKCNTKYKPKQLCSIEFADGSIPERFEKTIDEYRKTNNIANPVSKDLFPDGFSETLPLSCWPYISNLFQTTMIRLQPLQ